MITEESTIAYLMITAFETDDNECSLVTNFYHDGGCTMLYEVRDAYKLISSQGLPRFFLIFLYIYQTFSGFGSPGTCISGNAIVNGISASVDFTMASVATCPPVGAGKSISTSFQRVISV